MCSSTHSYTPDSRGSVCHVKSSCPDLVRSLKLFSLNKHGIVCKVAAIGIYKAVEIIAVSSPKP